MPASSVVAFLRRRYAPATPDAALLRDYADGHDTAAFRALVERHGPLVLQLCRRLLDDAHAGEDAFQATFLILARRATSVRRPDALAAWLFGVARRVCRNARVTRERREKAETRARPNAVAEPADDLSARELLDALDAELDRLPERTRLPLLLVYWQGLTYADAARQMGLTLDALHGRLVRGRAKLASRLRRRGFAPSVVLVAPLATVAVPSDLLATTAALAADPWSKALPVAVLGLSAASVSSKLVPATALIVLLTGIGAVSLITGAERKQPEQPPPVAPAPRSEVRVDRQGDPLPLGALLRIGTVRFRHPDSSSALSLSPDGRTLASLSASTVRMWDAETGKQLHRFATLRPMNFFTVAQQRLAFTPDSRFLVGGGLSAVAIWDRGTGAERTLRLDGAVRVHSVHASPDGRRLAVGSTRGITVFDWDDLKEIWHIDSAPVPGNQPEDRFLWDEPHNLALFLPDGGTLSINTNDASNAIRLCDPATGTERRRIELAARLVRLAFTPDGRYLAATERDNAVRVYEIATGRRVHAWTVALTNPYENGTLAVAVSPDGRTVAAGATDALIRHWDLTSGQESGVLRGHGWYVTGLAFAPDGRTLYSSSSDGTVRRWDLASGREKPVGEAANGVVAQSPDGAILASEAAKGAIELRSATSGAPLRTLSGNPAGFARLEFSPDGAVLAASGNNLSIQLWQVSTGRLLRQWSWPKGKDPHTDANDLAFSPDGRILATAVFRDHSVFLWDTATGEQLAQLPHQMVRSVAFTPDGQTLLSGGWDRYYRCWDVACRTAGEAYLVGDGADDPAGKRDDPRVECVTYSPDGRLMATLHVDGKIRIWDGSRRRLLSTYPGWKGQGRLLAFSPDSLWLLTDGEPGNVACIREPLTGQVAHRLPGHEGRLTNLSWRGDGRTAVSGSGDNTALLWTLRPPIRANAPRDMPALWVDLAAGDAAAAYSAVWELAERPAESIPFLKDKLVAAESVDANRVKEWLADLDNEAFAVREVAAKELAKVADRIEGSLRRALTDNPSAEKKRRLEALLDTLDQVRSSDRVRLARAVTALEWAATPAARQLLETLAAGDATAMLTTVAKAAVDRISRPTPLRQPPGQEK
jgi:RNA polymerase sigma factor (sigma-70 family)